MRSPALIGVHVALMATMIVWALNITMIKWLAENMDVMLSATLRMAFAIAAMFVFLAVLGRSLRRLSLQVLLVASVSGLLIVYGNQTLFTTAMSMTTASNAALILSLNPLLNGVMEAIFFQKKLRLHYLLGVSVTLAGVFLVIFHNPGASWSSPAPGDLLVLASMFSFAFGVVLLQHLSKSSNQLEINTVIYSVGTLALAIQVLIIVDSPLKALMEVSGWTWFVLLSSGVVATALGALAWGRGIAFIGAGSAAIYMSWVPILGVAFGALLLDEPLTIWHLLGMALVVGGTVLCNLNTWWKIAVPGLAR